MIYIGTGVDCLSHRLQYQTYDVAELLNKENELAILVGKGWYRSPLPGFGVIPEYQQSLMDQPVGLLAQLKIIYKNGTKEVISTDESWYCSESPVSFSEIYDGEIYDGSFSPEIYESVIVFDGPIHTLISQQGEKSMSRSALRLHVFLRYLKGKRSLTLDRKSKVMWKPLCVPMQVRLWSSLLRRFLTKTVIFTMTIIDLLRRCIIISAMMEDRLINLS